MSELIAIAFDDEHQADEALAKFGRMEKEYVVDLDDAAVVVRKQDGKVRLKQSQDLTSAGAATGGMWGGFWGLLIGLLFLAPFAGLVIGAAAGALGGAIGGHYTDLGIDDDFMKQVGDTLTPGSSAIFLLVHDNITDKVLEDVKGLGGTVINTSLSSDQEQQLQKALSEKAAKS